MHSRSPSKTNSQKIGHKKCKSRKKVLDLSNFYTGTNGNGRTYTDRTCRPCSNGEKNKRRGKKDSTDGTSVSSDMGSDQTSKSISEAQNMKGRQEEDEDGDMNQVNLGELEAGMVKSMVNNNESVDSRDMEEKSKDKKIEGRIQA